MDTTWDAAEELATEQNGVRHVAKCIYLEAG